MNPSWYLVDISWITNYDFQLSSFKVGIVAWDPKLLSTQSVVLPLHTFFSRKLDFLLSVRRTQAQIEYQGTYGKFLVRMHAHTRYSTYIVEKSDPFSHHMKHKLENVLMALLPSPSSRCYRIPRRLFSSCTWQSLQFQLRALSFYWSNLCSTVSAPATEQEDEIIFSAPARSTVAFCYLPAQKILLMTQQWAGGLW
jgi:hypothetical protein